nr:MAG: ORF1 [TTV-like mini virus]
MPYYNRRRRYNYRRPRWYGRGWIRRPFRRRLRRKRRVRKTYTNIILRQWQPPHKRTCYIKGQNCIIFYNNNRLGFNSTMYEKSIAPVHWPGGGSFSVSMFTLDGLYDMHKFCRNWWTNTNEDLPLCRYKGCQLKFYQCKYTDYIVKVHTELPANSNKLTYPSTQPGIMMMSKDKYIIPSKENRKKRKPYTKIFIKPPPQFENKWYFTTDIYKIPLLQIHASACNLNSPFLKPQTKSNTITFYALNTESIQNRNMSIDQNQSWPFKKLGTQYFYMYKYAPGPPIPTAENLKVGDLIPLTNPRDNVSGESFFEQQTTTHETWKQYFTNYKKHWGNIFNVHTSEHLEDLLYSLKSPEAIAKKALENENKTDLKWSELDNAANMALTPFDQPIFIPMQYNPERDTGQDTQLYLLSNSQGDGWDPPGIPELILEGFPLWLIYWGFLDFQKNLKKVTNIDTNYIMVCKTKYTQRPNSFPLVIMNESFVKGNSPYENKPLPEDSVKWYPQAQYQTEEQNKILQTGPFAPNILNLESDNITVFYKFYWKWGGSPPKHITVENPAHQIQYPIPRNEHETTSLQNPGQAPESILYSFDYRHGNYTTTALSRISQDWSLKDTVSKITEPDRQQLLRQAIECLQMSEETQEKKEKEVHQLISNLRQQQQLYRERIISLLKDQ